MIRDFLPTITKDLVELLLLQVSAGVNDWTLTRCERSHKRMNVYLRKIVSFSCSVVSSSLRLHELWSTRLLCPWSSPGKNTGVGCHFLLWGIFPTHGLNLNRLHWRQILYHLSHQGNLIKIIHKNYMTLISLKC